MLTDLQRPTADQSPQDGRSNGGFLGTNSLPTDPAARALERRGRRWLVVSFLLCPCHLPVTLGLLTMALAGTTLGSVVLGHTGWIAALLITLYALMLWQGFRRIRAAKVLASQGVTIDCTNGACDIPPRAERRAGR